MKGMRCFKARFIAIPFMLFSFFCICSKLNSQTAATSERLQQATEWINATIATAPIDDIRSLSPDERQTLIADLRAWVKNGQAGQSSKSPGGQTATVKPVITEKELFPNPIVLWASVPQVKANVNQASRWVYGVPYGAAKGTQSNFYLNPDSYLFTGTATFSFSQAFLSISNRTKLCSGNNVIPSTLCNNPKFMLGTRPQDSWQRLLSAITLVSTTAQNPRFSQGIVPEAGTISYQKTFSETVTGSFDPTGLFRTATDFNSGLQALKNDPANYAALPKPCLKGSWNDRQCLVALSYGYGPGRQWAEALVPTIAITAITASDLAKSGANTFIQPPTQVSALYQFSATWDLRKWMPNASTLADAASVVNGLAGAQNPSTSQQKDSASDSKNDPDLKWRSQVAWYCFQLVSNPAIANNDVWWTKFEGTVLDTQTKSENAALSSH